MSKLSSTANKLQKQTYKIIHDLRLTEILLKDTEIKLVGSALYNLMTWRDLDLDIRTQDIPTDKMCLSLVQHLFGNSHIKKIILVDNRDNSEPNRPRSVYVGPTYLDDMSNSWKIDIRVLAKKDAVVDSMEKLINRKMTNVHKEHILQLKTLVCDNPKYHKGFSSVDIYEAVILNKVTNIEELKSYLSSLGKSL